MAKRGRRANGEGSFTQLKNGLWQARASWVNPATGEMKRYAYYGKTKTEAHDKLIKAQMDMKTGAFVEPNKETFGAWVERWLNTYKSTKLRLSTQALYKSHYKTHIERKLGKIPLQKLDTSDVQKLINTLQKAGKSSSLVRLVHMIIKGALKQAQKEGKVFRNVADAVELPRLTRKKVQPLTKEMVAKFLGGAGKDRHFVAFLLEMATGLRRGELLALKWGDIDFEKGILYVTRSVGRVAIPVGDHKTQLIVSEPKTAKGKREIVLKGLVLKELKAYRLASGNRNNPDAYVFPSRKGSTLDPRAFAAKYARILDRAGVPKSRFHALRHTVAVLLLQAGEKPKNVQELLGHSRYGTTVDIYAEYMPDEEKQKTAETITTVLEELI